MGNQTAVEQVLLTIGQMAAQSGLSEHTLRYYEKAGLIQPVPREVTSGHRRYGPETVVRLESLSCLRASGLGLQEMKECLSLKGYGAGAAGRQKALFAAHADKVAEEIRRLQVTQRYLSGKVAYWDAIEQGDPGLAGQIAKANQQIAKELRKGENK
jgi:DNA-binding transcriptional MerR regulator